MTSASTSESCRGPVLTVWSDIGCPWASLALHTLREEARRSGTELLIDHRAFPLELFNSQPTPKRIVDAETVVIAAARPELGWRLWSAPESTYPSTTLPALEAVQAAKDPAIGGLAASDELDAALRRAFYADSRCIAVYAEIFAVAKECAHVDSAALEEAVACGAGRAAVFDQWRTARGGRIQGSPHLFAPDGWEAHNPGVEFRWTADPADGGLPQVLRWHPDWAADLLSRLAGS
ncbi:DsbA family oxidoreductase [Streptomyces aurantiogriseus]|uniref:Dithiol-disulfide isomerase n=1 Tax=Streptomyces aurantiogriseus TaxID=66870 RepID=A0A918C2U4_9ACTN|nr:DsbA family protein [Streptomyces aurantiogriseus]GGR02763.1 dithiol-disulfide isomerase [Streptomyces aurantiogriseus]